MLKKGFAKRQKRDWRDDSGQAKGAVAQFEWVYTLKMVTGAQDVFSRGKAAGKSFLPGRGWSFEPPFLLLITSLKVRKRLIRANLDWTNFRVGLRDIREQNTI